jgi:hypothetical protein
MGRTGPLYQGRFKSFPIQQYEHLLRACRHVERNALAAGVAGGGCRLAGASAGALAAIAQHSIEPQGGKADRDEYRAWLATGGRQLVAADRAATIAGEYTKAARRPAQT